MLSLCVALPIMAIVSVTILISYGRPVFFCQKRIGINKTDFLFVKFRTMISVTEIDGRLLNDEERITPVGSWLRRTSLDELPSLVHVIAGHMSLVGPRPLPLSYLHKFPKKALQRFRVKPGITGLAQVNGRSSLGWTSRFELDNRYIRELGFNTDLKILMKTVIVVFSRKDIDDHVIGDLSDSHLDSGSRSDLE